MRFVEIDESIETLPSSSGHECATCPRYEKETAHHYCAAHKNKICEKISRLLERR
jgi:hypothetical protein